MGFDAYTGNAGSARLLRGEVGHPLLAETARRLRMATGVRLAAMSHQRRSEEGAWIPCDPDDFGAVAFRQDDVTDYALPVPSLCAWAYGLEDWHTLTANSRDGKSPYVKSIRSIWCSVLADHGMLCDEHFDNEMPVMLFCAPLALAKVALVRGEAELLGILGEKARSRLAGIETSGNGTLKVHYRSRKDYGAALKAGDFERIREAAISLVARRVPQAFAREAASTVRVSFDNPDMHSKWPSLRIPRFCQAALQSLLKPEARERLRLPKLFT